jgi:hypothetical protein
VNIVVVIFTGYWKLKKPINPYYKNELELAISSSSSFSALSSPVLYNNKAVNLPSTTVTHTLNLDEYSKNLKPSPQQFQDKQIPSSSVSFNHNHSHFVTLLSTTNTPQKTSSIINSKSLHFIPVLSTTISFDKPTTCGEVPNTLTTTLPPPVPSRIPPLTWYVSLHKNL